MNEKQKYSECWSSGQFVQSKLNAKLISNLNPSKKILDIGCGNGCMVNELIKQGINAYGIDITKQAWESKSEVNPPADIPLDKLIEAPVWKLPFKDNEFDTTFSTTLLEHLPTVMVEKAIQEIMRVTKSHTIHYIDTKHSANQCGHELHLTIKPVEWWRKQFDKLNKKGILINLFDKEELKSKPKIAILFGCHFLNENILHQYERLKNEFQDADVFLLYDKTKKNEKEIKTVSRLEGFMFDVDSLKKLGYKSSEEITDLNKLDNELAKKLRVWHNSEHTLLKFYLDNPQYDYYWKIGHDATFTGDWKDFFNYFENRYEDFLGLFLKRWDKESDKSKWWDVIHPKVKDEDKRRACFQVIRLSNKALKFLDEKYKQGNCGYSEVLVPTLLYLNKFSIEDIGNKWYNNKTLNGVFEKNKIVHHYKLKDLELNENKI